jgi:hypothetical protein
VVRMRRGESTSSDQQQQRQQLAGKKGKAVID